MKADYLIHEQKYVEARAKGWNGWGGNARMALEHIWLERLFSYGGVPRTGRALELGCGEGHYCRRLAEQGYTVIGVDVSATAIQWAKEKTAAAALPIEYFEVDLTQPDVLSGRSFDLIADGNCVHCIIGSDRPVFLANIYRLLSPDGVFFISSLCSHSGRDEIIELEGRPYRHVPTQESLHGELEAAGFEIMQSVFHRNSNSAYSHVTIHLAK